MLSRVGAKILIASIGESPWLDDRPRSAALSE
jgi:hypothetical protein